MCFSIYVDFCFIEFGSKPDIDFDKLNNSTSIREAKFLELQKEIEIVNDQFKNALKHKHELMLQNETLAKTLHEAEIRLVLILSMTNISIYKLYTKNNYFLYYFLEKE